MQDKLVVDDSDVLKGTNAHSKAASGTSRDGEGDVGTKRTRPSCTNYKGAKPGNSKRSPEAGVAGHKRCRR